MNFLQANSANYLKGRTGTIQFIVIHYTGSSSAQGDTAKGNASYFANNEVKASAHYFVDEKEIWQSVKDADTAWHCGKGSMPAIVHPTCRNFNSIGIEMCSKKNADGTYSIRNPETIEKAVQLTAQLVVAYGIPLGNILRHYDVTHKICPAPFVNKALKSGETEEGKKAWADFLKRIEAIFTPAVQPPVHEPNKDKDEPSDWAAAACEKAVKSGLIKGDGAGWFGWKEPMTLERLMVIFDKLGLLKEGK